ncbi:MAG: M20/M25/M40 family metallo-hydrolase [Flavobacteriales bacterium]|nr:M20/M25/M40 family metallo-hydrolase [Flavobacteriales bacterium]
MASIIDPLCIFAAMWRTALFSILILLVACKSEQQVSTLTGGKEQLKKDITYLASDELEGRDTGTKGEALAAQYIADRFKALGLTPAGDEGTFYQTFEFTGSPKLSQENRLVIDGREIADSLYYPLNFSGSTAFSGPAVDVGYGIVAPDMNYDDYTGKEVRDKIVTMKISSPDGIHPHSAYITYHDLRQRTETAMLRGAKAVILYNDDPTAQAPSKTLTENVNELEIPVLFLNEDPQGAQAIEVDFTIERPKLQGKNVLALLDNGKERTFIIGAHYDHLGHGGGGSLHRGKPEIHNGADDNASGVAAMLELARILKGKELDHNVLFLGFSGEERGLLGSNFFVKNPTMNLEEVNYMLNMDMVGRLSEKRNKVIINGVGTSPAWDFIDSTLVVEGLEAKTTEAGTGPSDHMSFYLNDVPVLHFFSGTHEDYHKPSDDEHLINYDGIEDIIAYMEHIIYEVDDDGELEFTQTKEEKKEAARFKVTLGVIPDYLYEEKGMRIDGVTEGRPGQKAGIQKGDVIIRMGQKEIGDIYAYMEGLSTFETGETTTLVVLRDGTEVSLEVTFD